MRERIVDYSKGDYMGNYWALFWWREQCENKICRDILTFVLNRTARRHGGYIGNGARFGDEAHLPHGLRGIYISRYASIGIDCCIYQNVTVGEVDGRAPRIGNHCMIGAGAVVSADVPSYATVVAQPARIILREGKL